ncbi:hypothetical protein [Undibacterium sp.]|uniref:hypothetical protein n=1 Tax=Undibacterium sp. TaxID=1914977 RepID=UPI00272FE8AD|nr:hypothetical protein [Undibacterium sp.]MDP1976676.1 hypothetical protein [Undibacterium sp.]
MNVLRTRFRTRLIIALLCLQANLSFAQSADSSLDVKELCKQVFCRTPSFTLQLNNKVVFEGAFETPLPVLINKKLISVFPGETVFIEASINNGAIRLEQAVSTNAHPERTLVFKFQQMDKKKDMLLEVENPFPEDIKFKMGYMQTNSSKIYATSSCPVSGKLKLFEHWPYPIYQLLITQAKVLSQSDKKVCN